MEGVGRRGLCYVRHGRAVVRAINYLISRW